MSAPPDPSTWPSLAKTNPEFAKAWSSLEEPYTLHHPIEYLRERAIARKKAMTESAGPGLIAEVEESWITITARDGHAIPTKLYQPKSPREGGGPLVVFFHGGGYCLGNAEGEDVNARQVVKEHSAVALSVDYRKAPENPFPKAPEDAWDAVQWIAANASSLGADPSKGFLIGGTSAGANLSVVTGILARDTKLTPAPTGYLLMIPPVMDQENPPAKLASQITSLKQNAKAELLDDYAIDMFMGHYKPDRQSPLWNAFEGYDEKGPKMFEGLKPTVFLVCGKDPLRDEGLMFEKIMREDLGIKTKLHVYPGVPHGFNTLFPDLEESKRYFKETWEGMTWLLEQM